MEGSSGACVSPAWYKPRMDWRIYQRVGRKVIFEVVTVRKAENKYPMCLCCLSHENVHKITISNGTSESVFHLCLRCLEELKQEVDGALWACASERIIYRKEGE